MVSQEDDHVIDFAIHATATSGGITTKSYRQSSIHVVGSHKIYMSPES